MSKKPKAGDYKPTESDRASASVAMAEYQFFKEKYDPLLRQMRDQSLSDDKTRALRSRAGADTMQALTSEPSFQQTQNIGAAGDLAQAYTGQLGLASQQGKKLENTAQSNVLGIARKQAADAQSGMAQAARLDTSQALARAQAKQDVAQAKFNAAAQLGSQFVGQGIKNMRSGPSGTFFTPQVGTDLEGGAIMAKNMAERGAYQQGVNVQAQYYPETLGGNFYRGSRR